MDTQSTNNANPSSEPVSGPLPHAHDTEQLANGLDPKHLLWIVALPPSVLAFLWLHWVKDQLLVRGAIIYGAMGLAVLIASAYLPGVWLVAVLMVGAYCVWRTPGTRAVRVLAPPLIAAVAWALLMGVEVRTVLQYAGFSTALVCVCSQPSKKRKVAGVALGGAMVVVAMFVSPQETAITDSSRASAKHAVSYEDATEALGNLIDTMDTNSYLVGSIPYNWIKDCVDNSCLTTIKQVKQMIGPVNTVCSSAQAMSSVSEGARQVLIEANKCRDLLESLVDKLESRVPASDVSMSVASVTPTAPSIPTDITPSTPSSKVDPFWMVLSRKAENPGLRLETRSSGDEFRFGFEKGVKKFLADRERIEGGFREMGLQPPSKFDSLASKRVEDWRAITVLGNEDERLRQLATDYWRSMAEEARALGLNGEDHFAGFLEGYLDSDSRHGSPELAQDIDREPDEVAAPVGTRESKQAAGTNDVDQQPRVLKHPGGVRRLSFSRCGRLVAALGAKGGVLRVYDAGGGNEVFSKELGDALNAACFSPTADLLASSTAAPHGHVGDKTDARVYVWDHSGRPVAEFPEIGMGLCFSPDGQWLLGGGMNRLWRAKVGEWHPHTFAAPDENGVNAQVVAVASIRTANSLLYSTVKGNAVIAFVPNGPYTPGSGVDCFPFPVTGPIVGVAAGQSADLAFCIGANGEFFSFAEEAWSGVRDKGKFAYQTGTLWSAETRDTNVSLGGSGAKLGRMPLAKGVAVAADGQMFAIGRDYGEVVLGNIKDGLPQEMWVSSLFEPAVIGLSGMQLHSVADDTEDKHLNPRGLPVNALCFSPDTNWIAAGSIESSSIRVVPVKQLLLTGRRIDKGAL